MVFPRWYLCACIALMVGYELGLVNGQYYRQVGKKKLPYQTFIVDQSGQGNFTTVQAAIDSIPPNNNVWVCIKIRAGTYREKVKIPYEKPYIILKGAGKTSTSVIWDDHENLVQSATFTSLADNVVAKSMSFRNTYNNPINSNRRTQAAAAIIYGDKSAFYRCGFYGLQDTLWDAQGRHYYKKCTIEGAVDFIFGGAQSIFEKSAISLLGDALEPGVAGFITAQGRAGPYDKNGFVFKECIVYGTGKTYLGRAWQQYSRVIFYNSTFSNVVEPEGWDAWYSAGNEQRLTFVEYGCYGPGSDTSQRVSWQKKLSPADLEQFTSMSFIDNEGWLNAQPL